MQNEQTTTGGVLAKLRRAVNSNLKPSPHHTRSTPTTPIRTTFSPPPVPQPRPESILSTSTGLANSIGRGASTFSLLSQESTNEDFIPYLPLVAQLERTAPYFAPALHNQSVASLFPVSRDSRHRPASASSRPGSSSRGRQPSRQRPTSASASASASSPPPSSHGLSASSHVAPSSGSSYSFSSYAPSPQPIPPIRLPSVRHTSTSSPRHSSPSQPQMPSPRHSLPTTPRQSTFDTTQNYVPFNTNRTTPNYASDSSDSSPLIFRNQYDPVPHVVSLAPYKDTRDYEESQRVLFGGSAYTAATTSYDDDMPIPLTSIPYQDTNANSSIPRFAFDITETEPTRSNSPVLGPVPFVLVGDYDDGYDQAVDHGDSRAHTQSVASPDSTTRDSPVFARRPFTPPFYAPWADEESLEGGGGEGVVGSQRGSKEDVVEVDGEEEVEPSMSTQIVSLSKAGSRGSMRTSNVKEFSRTKGRSSMRRTSSNKDLLARSEALVKISREALARGSAEALTQSSKEVLTKTSSRQMDVFPILEDPLASLSPPIPSPKSPLNIQSSKSSPDFSPASTPSDGPSSDSDAAPASSISHDLSMSTSLHATIQDIILTQPRTPDVEVQTNVAQRQTCVVPQSVSPRVSLEVLIASSSGSSGRAQRSSRQGKGHDDSAQANDQAEVEMTPVEHQTTSGEPTREATDSSSSSTSPLKTKRSRRALTAPLSPPPAIPLPLVPTTPSASVNKDQDHTAPAESGSQHKSKSKSQRRDSKLTVLTAFPASAAVGSLGIAIPSPVSATTPVPVLGTAPVNVPPTPSSPVQVFPPLFVPGVPIMFALPGSSVSPPSTYVPPSRGVPPLRGVSPGRGVSFSPERGASLSPERGTSLSPERGASLSPERGTSLSPERGASLSPERGASFSPSRGTSPLRGPPISILRPPTPLETSSDSLSSPGLVPTSIQRQRPRTRPNTSTSTARVAFTETLAVAINESLAAPPPLREATSTQHLTPPRSILRSTLSAPILRHTLTAPIPQRNTMFAGRLFHDDLVGRLHNDDDEDDDYEDNVHAMFSATPVLGDTSAMFDPASLLFGDAPPMSNAAFPITGVPILRGPSGPVFSADSDDEDDVFSIDSDWSARALRASSYGGAPFSSLSLHEQEPELDQGHSLRGQTSFTSTRGRRTSVRTRGSVSEPESPKSKKMETRHRPSPIDTTIRVARQICRVPSTTSVHTPTFGVRIVSADKPSSDEEAGVGEEWTLALGVRDGDVLSIVSSGVSSSRSSEEAVRAQDTEVNNQESPAAEVLVMAHDQKGKDAEPTRSQKISQEQCSPHKTKRQRVQSTPTKPTYRERRLTGRSSDGESDRMQAVQDWTLSLPLPMPTRRVSYGFQDAEREVRDRSSALLLSSSTTSSSFNEGRRSMPVSSSSSSRIKEGPVTQVRNSAPPTMVMDHKPFLARHSSLAGVTSTPLVAKLKSRSRTPSPLPPLFTTGNSFPVQHVHITPPSPKILPFAPLPNPPKSVLHAPRSISNPSKPSKSTTIKALPISSGSSSSSSSSPPRTSPWIVCRPLPQPSPPAPPGAFAYPASSLAAQYPGLPPLRMRTVSAAVGKGPKEGKRVREVKSIEGMNSSGIKGDVNGAGKEVTSEKKGLGSGGKKTNGAGKVNDVGEVNDTWSGSKNAEEVNDAGKGVNDSKLTERESSHAENGLDDATLAEEQDSMSEMESRLGAMLRLQGMRGGASTRCTSESSVRSASSSFSAVSAMSVASMLSNGSALSASSIVSTGSGLSARTVTSVKSTSALSAVSDISMTPTVTPSQTTTIHKSISKPSTASFATDRTRTSITSECSTASTTSVSTSSSTATVIIPSKPTPPIAIVSLPPAGAKSQARAVVDQQQRLVHPDEVANTDTDSMVSGSYYSARSSLDFYSARSSFALDADDDDD